MTSGGWQGTSGRLWASYGWVALLIVASAVVNVLAATQHAGGFSNLRGAILDETTSAVVLIALLPILKRSVDMFLATRDRRVVFIAVALAIVVYAVLHVVLMVALRELIYPAFGFNFDFRWRVQFVPELRKDIISAFMIVVVFWLIDRRTGAMSRAAIGAATPNADARRPDIWLKDGSVSVRVDPADILSVTSAGNYVEFVLPDRRHLIRGTLAAEEARLKPFGFGRIHRSRLVNFNRVVAVEQRPNGDFVLRMDHGEAIAGSRRYRDALAAIKTPTG